MLKNGTETEYEMKYEQYEMDEDDGEHETIVTGGYRNLSGMSGKGLFTKDVLSILALFLALWLKN